MRVFPSGRKSYVCSYRILGRFRIATLGRADALTLDDARKKARAYLGRVASNLDPPSGKGHGGCVRHRQSTLRRVHETSRREKETLLEG
jgi:Arm DNA-binding domain